MKKIALMMFLMIAPAHGGSAFITGFDDLPLMPGLTELQGELITFDSPTGRIIENTVRGTPPRRAVLDFYNATLPQLGWRKLGHGRFAREDETLRLEFLSPDLTIRFILRPAEQ
ncbi:MAG TPA: hypothetical protein ENI69_10585 [Rhodospirillales bacterium]|nr:hypothetical protein [Rhodospirillales bacterium]